MKTAITGGIGSGKSYVCRLLERRGIRVYDCDSAAKRLMIAEPLRSRLTALVGPDAYTDCGLNKAAVARYLMSSADNARRLNETVHPVVAADFVSSGLQWMECAILYESGFDRLVDKVVAVAASEEVRVQRICRRDSITPDEARQWIARQMPQEAVCHRADYVVINDGDTAGLEAQLDRLPVVCRQADGQ